MRHMKSITSTQNEQLKHLSKLLTQSKARREYGQTVLEGVHLLQVYLKDTSGYVGFKLEEVEVSPSFFHRIMNTLILRPARWTRKFSPSCKVDANIKAVSIGIEVNGLDIPRLPQTKRDFKHLYVFHNVTTIPLLIILNSSFPTQNNEEPIYMVSGQV